VRRIGAFVELHVEQGRALAVPGSEGAGAVGVADSIWPHGRWRFDFAGEANHAGTTALADRQDPMLDYARAVLAARDFAVWQGEGTVATFGKVRVEPNGVNAIPSLVQAWLDARSPSEKAVRALVEQLSSDVGAMEARVSEESWTPTTTFDPALRDRLVRLLGGAPVLGTGAGHDAGILAGAGVSTGMLFVRNPSGISHSPAESAELDDCLTGVEALRTVLADLAS
jgi:N-carbamoyl-L-amino-acid hydrolase